MDNTNKKSIYDKNFAALSIERVTEIDSTVSKTTLLNNKIFSTKSATNGTVNVKPVDKLLTQIHKDTYFLLMNSSPLLEYQAVSNGTYNLFETKANLLKQYKTVEERIEKKKRGYFETLDVEKKK
ncbi:hypothetical protein HANVADRAFT_3020 [Hanseniaspora valbyensis NRRL Y-1626]|uniref:Uncharacterized protein n=1 Tax=Hanseniaspora valbyensis NRRL Y-1626 TaxID=766949 RepID=A0A1B7TBQ9_9ASCO|nr:hypothetical protein HANVADRAFT_3020 [Hanseniaspora valbyensis NRRL Y-1626]